MSILINWILMVLAVFGVIELTGMLTLWLNRPKSPPRCVMVVPMKGRAENPEQTLRYVRVAAQWSPETQRAMVVDFGLDEKSRETLRALCEEDRRVEFITRLQAEAICKDRQDGLY